MNHIPIHYETSDPDFRQLSDFVVSEMRRLSVPGVAVGLFHDGREHLAGFGITSVENPLPVTADTLFQIGSTTKTLTGTIVMRLVEQGLIDLDAPVKSYLPELILQDKAAEATVTTRHLLTHMGGWLGDFFRETGSGDDALARYVAEMAGLPQVVPAGALWSYNNAGFGLAGRVIEVVTGQTYEAVAQAMVLDPLGMDNSFFFPADVISRRFAVGHRVDEKDGVVVERPWALARSAHAVGGLCSSARDQMRYARFHLGDGAAAGGERLLSAETMAAMQSPGCPANLGRQMGLSWILKELGGERLVMHGGATNGQLSAFVMVPARGFALTVLTNADEGSMLHDEVVKWALGHYLGLVEPEATHLTLDAAALDEYLGTYTARLGDLELYVADGQPMARQIPHGGFPDVDSPPSPAPPPSRIAFFAPDGVIALDPPLINMKAEFLRDDAGRIVWLRTSRLHRKLAVDS
jgi:CubicO group peptidase (beta-lactamase class C family)